MVDMAALKAKNAERWAVAKTARNFISVAKSLVAAKSRYLTIEKFTGVPWYIVAVIHERESSQSWKGSLAQGDPWNEVSTHVPKGRGPFQSWEAAAIDALINCSPYAAKNHDWSVGGSLTLLEEYNGLGYAARGIPSPYVWSGTNVYIKGKYVRDGVFNPDVVDVQLGCAGLLLAMIALDSSIQIGGRVAVPQPAPSQKAPDVLLPKPVSPVTAPAKGSVVAAIVAIFKALFGRK
jgi:lysozyme family protein